MQTFAKKIVLCENPTLDPERQSDYVFKYNHGVEKAGSTELSFGLAQIHLPDWPTISLKEAQNTRFSLQFLVSNLEQGHESMWLTCSQKAIVK